MNDKVIIQLTESQYGQLLSTLAGFNNQEALSIITLLQEQRIDIDKVEMQEQLPQQEFVVGDKVRGLWQKGPLWYNGTIITSQNGRYFIRYDDGDEEWTTAEFIQLLFKPGSPENNSINYQIGDRVEVRWKGGVAWYKGTIQEIKDDRYYIQFDDGDVEWTRTEFMIKI